MSIKNLYNKFRKHNSKKKYFSNFFEENKNNIKKTWIAIRTIINTTISPKTPQLNVNSKINHLPIDISNTFNNFFVNMGPNYPTYPNTESEIPRVIEFLNLF